MFIDTHAHLNFKEFENEIPQILKNAENADVKAIVNVGSNFSTSKKCLEIADQYAPNKLRSYNLQPKIYAAVGTHPIHLVKDIIEEATFDGKVYKFKTKQEVFDYDKYKKLVQSSNKVVAIGETGLDYFRLSDNSNFQFSVSNFQSISNDTIFNYKKIQKKVFEEHIRLAKELGFPLILHCRGSENNPYDAYNEILKILHDTHLHLRGVNGVIHCFGGNLKQAREFINLGFYIGFTGIVTFKNAQEIQEVARLIPLEKILIETDCPFLAPVPYRGKRNEPAYVIEVARKIAELKNISLQEVEKTTTQNAKKLFEI